MPNLAAVDSLCVAALCFVYETMMDTMLYTSCL
jgi:hypothetical protein